MNQQKRGKRVKPRGHGSAVSTSQDGATHSVSHGAYGLRKTKQRMATDFKKSLAIAAAELNHAMARMPRDVWLIIFRSLGVESWVQCQLVCKNWYQIVTDRKLWLPLIDAIPYEIRDCQPHLTINRGDYWLGGMLKTWLVPHVYYAQITFRGFENEEFLRKHATIQLLDKWFQRQQWTLLFQTLAPLHSWNGDPLKIVSPNLCDPDHTRIKTRLNNLWLSKRYHVHRLYGNVFAIEAKIPAYHEKHIIFHAEHFRCHQGYYSSNDDRWNDTKPDPGVFLEQREHLNIAGSSLYSGKRMNNDFVYCGFKCMLSLHAAGLNDTYNQYTPENKDLWRATFLSKYK